MSESARTRASLAHPVIDSDGHILEFEPFYYDYVKEEGGESALKEYKDLHKFVAGYYAMDAAQKHHIRAQRPAFGLPTKNTLDLATAMMPRLMYQRLDEFGLDYMIVYPTYSLAYLKLPDAGMRKLITRAINRCHADLMREYSDRMTIAALIPSVTPDEAIEAIDYAVDTLGFKVACMDHAVRRPVPAFKEAYPDAPRSIARHAQWIDTYALESPYDYDPLWQRCVDKKIHITTHLPGFWGARTSTTNYIYNHLGQFADSGEASLKGLLLGGVPKRFPKLKFAFLEGGVGWACRLYCDLIEHFEKRDREGMENYHPDHLDHAKWKALCEEYGGPKVAAMLKDTLEETSPNLWYSAGWCETDRDELDEWKKSGITELRDIADQFENTFYFGCEADDRSIAWAFDSQKILPLGVKMHPMFGSDISHWDVVDMSVVLHEAHEMIEKKVLSADQFREFTFENAANFHRSARPDFFKGTVVENDVASLARSGS